MFRDGFPDHVMSNARRRRHVQGMRLPCQAVKARLGGSSGENFTAAHGLLRSHGPRLPPRLPSSSSGSSRRLFSDKPSGSPPSGSAAQPSAMQRARQATAASSGAFKALTQTAGSTSQKVFGQLPDRVRPELHGLHHLRHPWQTRNQQGGHQLAVQAWCLNTGETMIDPQRVPAGEAVGSRGAAGAAAEGRRAAAGGLLAAPPQQGPRCRRHCAGLHPLVMPTTNWQCV